MGIKISFSLFSPRRAISTSRSPTILTMLPRFGRQENSPSLQDYFLIPLSMVILWLTSTVISRLLLVLMLFPLYLSVKLIPLLPKLVTKSPLLLLLRGRRALINSSDEYRKREERCALDQLLGNFQCQWGKGCHCSSEAGRRALFIRAENTVAPW